MIQVHWLILIERWTLSVGRRTLVPKQQTFNAQRPTLTSHSDYAYHCYLLSRCNFLLVFLRRAGLGGIKKALRRQSGISVEDRANGQVWSSHIAGAARMVLPAQRNDHALAVHAQ